jgi:hypothetical protein
MEHKNSIAEIITATVAVAILILMILLIIGLGERMDKIEKALTTPTIARTSVIHGFFQDQQNPKNSGLRMIRVARDGTLVVLPLMPPKVPEKKDAPGK